KWDFNLRLEAREAESSDKWGVISGLFGEPADGVGVSTDLKHFRTEASTCPRTEQTDIRLGLVYRPLESEWVLLDRLRYSSEEESGGGSALERWKVVNNFNASYRPGNDLQVSLQYGLKYARDTLAGQVLDGTTHLIGAQGRYDLRPRWDLGAWSSVLTAHDAGTTDYGLGASVGYGLAENIWMSLGYNLLGYEDSDFSQGDFTAQGPFLKFRLKFDQETVRDLLQR
ncbi:MAG: hypothetical protein JSV00_03675, partial [bacterium]